jgi:hypothetical protein
MPLLQYDEHKVEDLDTGMEDHVADEVRYFCMSRPIKPRMAASPDPYTTNPMNIFLDIPKSAVLPSARRPRLEIIEEE